MARIETWLKCDLKKLVTVQYLQGNIFSQDNQANLIGVELYDNGTAVTASGTVTANIIREDGATVTATGSTSGNKVSVVLPAAAYAIPGAIAIIIKITLSGVITTIAAVVGTVYRSTTDTPVDPGTIMPSIQTLISQIQTAVASIPADYSSLWTSLAPAFSASTNYAAGQHVTNNGKVYRFNTAHTAGAWVASEVTEVKLGNEIYGLKSAFTNELLNGNAFDILPFCDHPGGAHRGVTFTWNSDNTSCTAVGTATGGLAVRTFFNEANSFPKGMTAGGTYRLKYASTDVVFQVYKYVNGVFDSDPLVSSRVNKDFTIPSNVSGVQIRLAVASGNTVNETVSPVLLTEVPTNAELSDSDDKTFGVMTSHVAVTDAVLNDSDMVVPWRTHMYLHQSSGAVLPTELDYSVSEFIRIPKGARAIIKSYFRNMRYALYDKDTNTIAVYPDESGVNIVIPYTDAAFFRLQYPSVDAAALENVIIMFDYSDRLARMSDIKGETDFSNEYGTNTDNPALISGSSAKPLSDLTISGAASGEILSLCGKNLFHFQHKDRSGFVKNGVTFHFRMLTQIMEIDSVTGATADTISADATCTGCTHLDGVLAYHNFHFRFKVDTPVTITPNYSYDPYYDDKILLSVYWVDNGTLRALPIGYEGTTIVAKAGVQYGIRVRVSAGFVGSVKLKPQVEIGTKNTAFEQYSGLETSLLSAPGESNIFLMPEAYRLKYNVASGVTAEFGYLTKSVRVTAESPDSNTVIYHPDYDGLVNGNAANYLFRFTPGAVPVCVQGVPDELQGLAKIQIVDGTTVTDITGSKPYCFDGVADKQYGYRIVVLAGSMFDYTFYPVIATGLEAVKYFGTSHPITSIYTDGNASLSVQYEKETKQEKAVDAAEVSKNINILTAGKIASPFSRLQGVGPVVTFIDDDTTNPTLVQRFHDILAAEGVVGNYAVELRNVENYQDTIPQMLLDYEQEGFGMLYHCYKQDGDADRYWESGNAMYDETLIRQNFYRGLRAYKQLGLNSARYWVTPYGVNDEFIRKLAKEADMECLLSCPTGTYTCNAVLSLGSNFYRYNMPRWIFLSSSDNDYQGKLLIDGCAANRGWLIIVTHVNSWPAAMIEQNTQRLTALIQYAKTAGCEIKNFIEAYQTYKPLLLLNELF